MHSTAYIITKPRTRKGLCWKRDNKPNAGYQKYMGGILVRKINQWRKALFK